MKRNHRGGFALAVLSMAYVCAYMDRHLLSLLIEPIRRDLRITDTEVSLLSGLAFAAFYAIFALPFGRLADVTSRRNVIAAGVSVWSLMTISCGAATNFIQMFLARMGVGIGEAALPPAAYSMIADYFSTRKLALAMSIFVLGAPIGAGFALVAGGAIVGWVDQLPPLSLAGHAIAPWQVTFLVVGGFGFLVSLLMLFVVEPDRTKLQGFGTSDVSEVIGFFRSNATLMFLLIGGLAILNVYNYGMLAWLATFFIRIHGWSLLHAGFSIGMMLLVFGSVGVLSGGAFVNLLTARGKADACLRAVVLAAGILLPASLILGLSGSPGIAYLVVAPLMFGLFFVAGVFPTLIQIITPNLMRGQVSAVFLFIVNLAGLGLGPTCYALVTDHVFRDPSKLGQSLAYVSTCLLGIAGAMILAAMPRYRKAVL